MTKPTSEQVTFLAAGSGASQRTVLDKLRDVVSVKDFGAVGDGVADDAPAINQAVKAVFDAGGGVVFIPKGTYLFGTTDATFTTFYIVARNNVSIIGDGIDATVLKVKDNENLRFRGTTGPFVIATSQAQPLSNCRFSDFTVNWNGTNNLLVQPGTGSPPDTARNNASVFSLRGGINIICERLRITGTPGNQCIFLPAQSNLGQRNITVRDCIFENNGSAVSGNYCADHSSLYCNGDFLTYENNLFRNDAASPQFMACYELHGSNCVASGNRSENYSRAFWIASDYEAISGIKVQNEHHENIEAAFSVTAQTLAINDVTVENCRFIQRSGLSVSYPSFFINGNTVISCSRLAIENCELIGQGYAQATMQHQRIRDVVFRGNKVSGFASYGIISGGVDLGGGIVIDNMVVQDNVFTDVSSPIYFNAPTLSAGGQSGAVLIDGNTFNRTASDAAAVITTAFSSSRGIISSNTFASNYSTKYAGNSNGLSFPEQTIVAFVPTVTGSITPGSATYSTQAGQYILNDKICTVTVWMTWTGHTGSGNAQIMLPFTVKNNGIRYTGVATCSNYAYSAGKQVALYTVNNAPYALMSEISSGAALANAAIAAAATIIATITYEIA